MRHRPAEQDRHDVVIAPPGAVASLTGSTMVPATVLGHDGQR